MPIRRMHDSIGLGIATVAALAGQRLRLGLTDGMTIEREVGALRMPASRRADEADAPW